MLAVTPPAPPPAFSSVHVMAGVANPEWIHLGFEVRNDHLGYSLSAGTLALAYDVSGTCRYFWSDADGGLYGEVGASLVRENQLSDLSPQAWTPMAYVGVGYQLVLGKMVSNIGLGLQPLPLPPAQNQPIFVTNAQALPRVLVQVGFAL